ncbi:MAG: 4-alpha-glucanotransferase [Bacilli bacterium]|nr:4-alpha-glucanotransferase [Bacilli bacterium]MDD4077174.1 4-alpha-glucanotransferase [Bacilli bacterium]MDD4387895.1 4-alpha-glucanotransferase [Bacilli bacterium]
MRESGILLPVSSLNDLYGIGTLGKEAYKFIDFLSAAGQRLWQVLPLGPTSFGDSPYQTFSVFAGNPYFIDFELMQEEGLLVFEDYRQMASPEGNIDYLYQYQNRFSVLRKAYNRFTVSYDYNCFIIENKFWLDDYALFMAIKKTMPEASWDKWDTEYRFRQGRKFISFLEENQDELGFWRFVQYCFFKQWHQLKAYANCKKVKIIGDLPIYVAYDSSDVWSNPLNWQLDGTLTPLAVAGCPPDAFSPDGQLWGNPLYNYTLMAEEGYSWWIERIRHAFNLYNYLRIDHFRGFEAYYAIPFPAANARNGTWIKGPGIGFFRKIQQKLGELNIIAEDLGFLTDAVYKLRDETGYMGMKVLQFAFNHQEDSEYLPHNHIKKAVCYTGTHDNLPTKAWFKTISQGDLDFVYRYLGIGDSGEEVEKFIKAALASVCEIVIIPMPDYLELGSEARFNTPATLGGNWLWRLKSNDINNVLAKKIYEWTKLYRRAGE